MSTISLLDEIPTDFRTPGTYIRVRPNYSQVGLLDFPAYGLIVTQKLATGKAQSGKVYPLFTADQGKVLGGVGSIGAQMVQAWFDNNPWTPVDVIFLDDLTSGTAATGVVFFPGFVTSKPSAFICRIGGTVLGINLATGATQNDAAAQLAAAINAAPDLPVTAVVATTAAGTPNSVNLTSRHAGLCGNAIDVELIVDLANQIAQPRVYAAGPVGPRSTLSGGIGNPDFGSVLGTIASSWYTDIVMPWTDPTNVAELATELARRYTASVRQDAHGYVAYTASLGTFTTAIGTPNCPFLSPLPMQGGKTLPWITATALAAVACYRSSQDPALQMRGVPLVGVIAPDQADRFTEAQQNILLHNGASTYQVTPDGSVILQRVATSRTLTDLGAPDPAWIDIMAPKVATRIRWDFRNYINILFPSNKLAPDSSRAAEYDPTIATPKRLKASWVGRTALYERAGWIQDVDNVNKRCDFRIDPGNDNRCLATLPYKRIGNLMQLDADLEFQV